MVGREEPTNQSILPNRLMVINDVFSNPSHTIFSSVRRGYSMLGGYFPLEKRSSIFGMGSGTLGFATRATPIDSRKYTQVNVLVFR